MKENTTKIIISAIAAGLSAYFRVMAIPIVILVLVMIIDYITGMWKAWNRGELSSRVGLKGLFKKVGYIFVVAVSGVLDWLFISGLSQIGIEVNVQLLLRSYRNDMVYHQRVYFYLGKSCGNRYTIAVILGENRTQTENHS